ncbi:hypothetical protein B296_00023699 [Ensete ventricosum]|uniref:Uncharacterized protein n=1 Tax=Ensete ventricosum TaxID=4639 RepID=A0A426X2V3_ENSVE|nr:hypothetical protein B296_00023699 [Ensete ventricosum]
MRSCKSRPGEVELSLEDMADLKRGGSVRTLAESGPSRLSRVLRLGIVGQPRPDIRVGVGVVGSRSCFLELELELLLRVGVRVVRSRSLKHESY